MANRTRHAVLVATLSLVAAAKPLTAVSSVADVLDAMQARGADLKAFTADVTQTHIDVNSDVHTTYRGHVWFQFLPGGDARMRLTLDTKQKGKAAPVPYPQEYLLGDGWLTARDGHLKNETRRQVARPGQKIDLFQLGKGPFPLPIGQSRAVVERQFNVQKVPPAAGDPPHTIHLALTPKPGSRLARQFQTVDFWIDTQQDLPVQIETLDAGGVDDQINELTHVVVNPDPPLTTATFTLPPVNGWNVVTQPLGAGPN